MSFKDEDQLAISFLLNYLQQQHSLPERLVSEYRQHCKVIKVKKSKYILSPVDNNKYLYYIVSGTVRGFIRDQGQEITTWFAFEQEIMGALRHPEEATHYSEEYLHALENCMLVCIPYLLIDRMCEEFAEGNKISRKFLTLQYFSASQRSILARIPKATDRYKRMLTDERFIMSRIPLRHLASYLSMRLETLSRIRKKEFDSSINLKEALADVAGLAFV
ncbi:Crp/Fnr family transcriptional regulator [Pedobacter nototheniae]|uniref:Crp/Fnr family transcriptional regulator n=1 Tax=Pedobacter nototheniae TaxID=2488994 RepID=UPI0029303B4F|nr:Crp/Fnr family transcriptional regulator [Pedobacter nototheniae]